MNVQVVGRAEFRQGSAPSLGGGVIVVQVPSRYHDEWIFLALLLVRFLEAGSGKMTKTSVEYLSVHDLRARMFR